MIKDDGDFDLNWLGVDLRCIEKSQKIVEFNCDYCGNLSSKPSAWYKRTKTHFCGKPCYDMFQNKSVIKQCIICGNNFMVRPCESHKFATCENTECRRKNKLGKNNPNYRDGSYSENKSVRPNTKQYKEWRDAVLKKDKYTCQMCGATDKKLQADHIRPWAYFKTLRYDVENGRTLCVDCHRTTFKDVFSHRDCEFLPEAAVSIDFDDTLAHNTGYPEFTPTEPIIGAKEALDKFHADGWKIVIYTARAWSEYDRVKNYLNDHSIYYDKIICGKLLAKYYIDDRNIEFDGNWEKTLNKIRRK